MIFLAFYRMMWKPPAIGVIDRFRIAQFLENIPENARADHFVPLNKKVLRVAIGCLTVAGPLFVILTQTISQPNDVIIGLSLALFVLFFWALCQIPILLISHRIASQEAANWASKVIDETSQWMLCSLYIGNASNAEPKLMQLISSESLEKHSQEFTRDLSALNAKEPSSKVDLSRNWEIAIRMLVLHSNAQQKNWSSCEICFSYLVAVGFDSAAAPLRPDISFTVRENGDVVGILSKRERTLDTQNWIISANANSQ